MTRKNYSIQKEHAFILSEHALTYSKELDAKVTKQSILETLLELVKEDSSVDKQVKERLRSKLE